MGIGVGLCCCTDEIDCTISVPQIVGRSMLIAANACERTEPSPDFEIGAIPPAVLTFAVQSPDGRMARGSGPWPLALASYGATDGCLAAANAVYAYSINPPTQGHSGCNFFGVSPECTGGSFIRRLNIAASVRPNIKIDSHTGETAANVSIAVNDCAGTKEYYWGNQFDTRANGNGCYPLSTLFGASGGALCEAEVGKASHLDSVENIHATLNGVSPIPSIGCILTMPGQGAIARSLARWVGGESLPANRWTLRIEGAANYGETALGAGAWEAQLGPPRWYRHPNVRISLTADVPRAALQAARPALYYLTERWAAGPLLCQAVAGLPDPVPAGTAIICTPPGARFAEEFDVPIYPGAAGGHHALFNRAVFEGSATPDWRITQREAPSHGVVESQALGFTLGAGQPFDWVKNSGSVRMNHRFSANRTQWVEGGAYVLFRYYTRLIGNDCPVWWGAGYFQCSVL